MNAVKVIKKCFIVMLVFLLVFALFPSGFTVARADELPDPVIITFSESHEDDEIVIRAIMQRNLGISDATFKLKYDNEALTLTSYEKGVALNTLDFLPSKTVEVYPFVFLFDSNGSAKTDSTTGTLFTLHFKIKDTAKNGECSVGIISTAVCWSNGYQQDVKAISDVAKFTISDKQISDVVVEVDVVGETDDQNANNTLYAIIISSATVGVLLVVYVIVVVMKRKRNRAPDSWVEL